MPLLLLVRPAANCFELNTRAVLSAHGLSRWVHLTGVRVAAVAEASATTCATDEGEASARAEATANAIADACAYVFASIDTECGATGDFSFACACGDAAVSAQAEVVAEAIAVAWAEAVACDACSIEVDTASAALTSAIVSAATQVQGGICALQDGDVPTFEDWRSEFDVASIEAIATAVTAAEANAESGLCNAVVSTCAVAGDENGCCTASLTASPEEVEQENALAVAGAHPAHTCHYCPFAAAAVVPCGPAPT